MAIKSSEAVEAKVRVDYGAEAFVEMLNANQVEYLFINSGTDTFPIQEAIAKFLDTGRRAPSVILCPDEATAISAAHGYFMVTRRPQVVLVHVDAGTLQLGGGLHNAQRGRIGIVLCAGRAPMTFEGELPGTRTRTIHWIQEQLDQAGVLRNFTKWDYELRRTENIQHVMQRAFQVASSEPAGPVYLALPREVLMMEMTEMSIPAAGRHGPVTTPQADSGAIKRIAEALVKAENPLIITGYSGRNHSTVTALVDLAETVGAPVVSESLYMNFPSTHPLYAGVTPNIYLGNADVILVVDQDVPYIPAHVKPGPDAQIFHIDIDPIKQSIPLWVFPTDVAVHADSAKALPSLVDAARGAISAADQARIDERYQTIRERHEQRRQDAEQAAQSHAKRAVITPEWLSYCINQVIDQDTVVIDECVTNSPTVAAYVQRSQPGTLYKSGGASLGWGLGGALGAKLAAPNRMVAAVLGDGAFIYGCPTSTLWAADAHDAPFLAIIYNNQLHYATKRSLEEEFPDSYAARTNNWVGMELSPSVDFATLAQACRAYGETVDHPDQVIPALERALQEVKGGRTAVLDVRIERP
ncbi:MAG: thiamine pyrophosphate-requiring protein [Chloroflexi bacterium]|nr:thiamine pyrophosphate-requiring protein [Chloroflexota bacterium]